MQVISKQNKKTEMKYIHNGNTESTNGWLAFKMRRIQFSVSFEQSQLYRYQQSMLHLFPSPSSTKQ